MEEVTPITPDQEFHHDKNIPTVHPPKYSLLIPVKNPSTNLSLPNKNTIERIAKKLERVNQCKAVPGLTSIIGRLNIPSVKNSKLIPARIWPILLALSDCNYSFALFIKGFFNGFLELS